MRNLLFFCSFLCVTLCFPQVGTWNQIEFNEEPQARHENGLVAVGDKIILIGGRGEKRIDIFDIAKQTWIKGAQPPLEIHHMQLVELDGLIYVLGGFTGSWPYETPLSHILIYDVTEDSWAIGPEIPEDRKRGAAGAVVKDKKIYLVNGIINGHTSGWVNWLDEFDPYSNTWKVLPNAPQARDHFQSAVIGDNLYVAGGRRSGSGETGFSGTIKDAERYNFKSGNWEKISNLPTERAGTAAAIFNNQFVVIGGESENQEAAHREVEIFNPETNSWTQLPSLQSGRHGTQAVNFGNTILIGAGSGNRGGGPELTSFEIFSAEGKENIQDLNLKPMEKAQLKVSEKEISLQDKSSHELLITNTSPDKAVFISYLQLDNSENYNLEYPHNAPFIIAPNESITVRVEQTKSESSSLPANLFIKSLGNSEPLKVQLVN